MRADYVIVGAGSAGCAMAYRLSEAGKSVVVIEFGGTDAGPFIQMPAALSYPMNMKRYDWGYYSEPEPYLGGRRMATPRGKVIGGSSSINGMIYVRGHALDYEFWSESGASGWSYAEVLPYFKRMESWHDGGHGGEESWRGSTGPLHISRGTRKNPLTKAFVEAGHQAGYPLTADYNGAQQEGFGPFDSTIWNGRRWSAAAAYLRPALKLDNCHLLHGLAKKVIIENGRAIGVKILRGKKSENIFASEEVILAASSINSPKILMLSGIGPAKHLAEHGISIVANRPGVGQNLQDHLEMYIQMEAIKPVSLSKYWNFVMKGLIGAQWLLTKKGLGASNQFESAAFIRSAAGVKYPDIQYHFLPIAMQYDGSTASDGHSFQAHVGPMRSPSRGFVELNSNNPIHDPKIQFNYMSHEKDWIDFRNCIRLTREIFAQKAFIPFVGKEIQPGADYQSDDELDDFTRNNVESAYHPCGTCKMGAKKDPMSVVDPKCSVIGVERLRVADSSIFPRITNGNLNAPSIMTGEKAADHILQRAPLPAENSEPWIHPSWETDQR
jgi:choline dehydrogenase